MVETLRYVADEYRQVWQSALERTGPESAERLAALIEADFEKKVCDRNKIAVWFAFWGEIKCRPAYRDICGQIDAERLKEFERLCGLINEEGQYPHVDPSFVAKCLESLIDGIWLNKLCQPEVYRCSEAGRMCISFLAAQFPRHFPLNDKPQSE